MSPADLVTALLTAGGLVFFVAGAAGMVRFPDMHSRLHALTKADNLALGLIVLGAAAQVDRPATVLKLILIWVLALVAAGITSQILARAALPPNLTDDT